MNVFIYNKNQTEVYQGTIKSVNTNNIMDILRGDWFFDWVMETKKMNRHVYKLTMDVNNKVQGIISFEYESGFIMAMKLESHPHNRRDTNRMLIAPPLLAFLCQHSIEKGFEGYVCIYIKYNQRLMVYYEKLGAFYIGNNRMVIHPVAARKLIKVYLNKGGGDPGEF